MAKINGCRTCTVLLLVTTAVLVLLFLPDGIDTDYHADLVYVTRCMEKQGVRINADLNLMTKHEKEDMLNCVEEQRSSRDRDINGYRSNGAIIDSQQRGYWDSNTELEARKYIHQFDIQMDSKQTELTKPWKCVNLAVPQLAVTPICIYDPAIDVYVSGTISKKGHYEGETIANVISLMGKQSQMQFLDLGCNIGVYTLSVAKYGRQVLAIDANRRNLRLLSKSITLGGPNLQQNVKLLWNAISDKVQNVSLEDGAKNVGGTMIKEMTSNSWETIDDDHKAVAITLNHLTSYFKETPVFVKMDIETYEWHALQGADVFFRDVDVPYILFEWAHHNGKPSGDSIYKFMSDRKYQAFHPITLKKLSNQRSTWPLNVMWMRQ